MEGNGFYALKTLMLCVTYFYMQMLSRAHHLLINSDKTRLVPSAIDNIKKSLEWAGLEYDYGS